MALENEKSRALNLEAAREVEKEIPIVSLVSDTPEIAAAGSVTMAAVAEVYAGPKFKVGDRLIYPPHNVVEVIAIEGKDIVGGHQPFYILQIIGVKGRILVPVNNEKDRRLRRPASEEEIKNIFNILREQPGTHTGYWHRKFQLIKDKMKSGSIFEIAEVLRDLSHLNQNKPKLSEGERTFLVESRTIIAREIAAARGQTEEQVLAEIEAILPPKIETPKVRAPRRRRQQV